MLCSSRGYSPVFNALIWISAIMRKDKLSGLTLLKFQVIDSVIPKEIERLFVMKNPLKKLFFSQRFVGKFKFMTVWDYGVSKIPLISITS